MKIRNLFIIMLLLLTFASISNTEQVITVESPPVKSSISKTKAPPTIEDTIKIDFNKNTFIKKFPRTLSEALETIKGLQDLFNVVSSSYQTLDSSYNIVKSESSELASKANNYKDEIECLLKTADSLSSIIEAKSSDIKTITNLYIDSIGVLADLVNKYKKDVNFGIGVGYASGDLGSTKINEYTLSPMVIYKKLYATLDIGVYAVNDEYKSKVGTSVGFFFK